jgi:hypothetical protein
MLSKKELIIKGFSAMNISLLEVLLENDKTYQNATKETFLEKLNEAFESFRLSKDTALLPYVGKCIGCSNKGCTGFSFVGNHSKKSINLIFDETTDNYKDIYNCSIFKIEDESIATKHSINLDFKLDEKANFSPLPSKALVFQNCKKAYNEIVKSNAKIITKQYLLNWLERNRKLYQLINEDSNEYPLSVYRSIDNFKNLCQNIEGKTRYTEFAMETVKAINEYQKLDVTIEVALLKWLILHEELYNEVEVFSTSIISDGKIILNYPIILSEQKFMDGNYTSMSQFETIFEPHYRLMLNKYQIPAEMYTSSKDYEKFNSLKYQLEKRGIQL